MMIAVVIISLAVSGLGLAFAFGGGSQQASIAGGQTPATPAQAAAAVSQTAQGGPYCGEDGSSDMSYWNKDNNGASVTYINGTLLLKGKTASGVDWFSQSAASSQGTTLAAGTSTITDAYPCGGDIDVYIQHDLNGTNSLATPEKIVGLQAREDPVRVQLDGGSRFSTLQMRVFDNNNNGYVVANVTNAAGTTDNTIAPGQILNFTTITSNATGLTVGADGNINYRIELKTTEGDKFFGKPHGFLVGIDTESDGNQADWDEDTVSLTPTTSSLGTCTDVSSSWNDNDLAALSAYEVVFHCTGAVTETAYNKLEFYLKSGSGVNPDLNLGLTFVHLGDYLDEESGSDVITARGFRSDGSTRTQIALVQRAGLVVV